MSLFFLPIAFFAWCSSSNLSGPVWIEPAERAGMDHAALPPMTMRLASYAGYKDIPTVCSSMSFLLPPFKLVTSRLIRASGRVWEAWSPNSDRVAYYPGVPDARFTTETPVEPALRRADGHLGRFDPTRNPQLLVHDRLWYPFIRPECDADTSRHPEYTAFTDLWIQQEPDSRS